MNNDQLDQALKSAHDVEDLNRYVADYKDLEKEYLAMSQGITDAHIAQIIANLKDFGYQVTEPEVKDQVDKILNGDSDLDIIGMFAKGMLEEARILDKEA